MNELEQLHLDAIDNSYEKYNYMFEKEKAASKSAEITEQIAIEFAEWIKYHHVENNWFLINKEYFYLDSYKLQFQEFLKTKQ